MAAVNDTGESGMLLIGPDGSLKLHGGSTIFSGDNQTQHALLAQKNTDGTMNVYMVPSTGPNKGKMFMVMPSQNGSVDGQGWKMVNLDDGKTILSPTYKQNATVYVPPSLIPPNMENVESRLSGQTNQGSSSLKSVQNLSNVILPIVVPSSTITVSNNVVNTITSGSVNTTTVTNTSKPICWSEQGVKYTLHTEHLQDKTNVSQANTAPSGIRPMWLFTHEAAANLGKNNLKEKNDSGGSESVVSKANVSEVKLPITVQPDKVIYPLMSSVNKPNILLKSKAGEDKSTVNRTDIKSQAQFISPLTSAPVFKSDETLIVRPSSSVRQPLYTPVKNVIAIPGKLTNSGKQIVVYPRPATTVPYNMPDLKLNPSGYISLLTTSQSEAIKVPQAKVSSLSAVSTSISVPTVAQSPSKSANGHYVITMRAKNPVTEQNNTSIGNASQISSNLLNTITLPQTYTTASNVRGVNGLDSSLTTSNSIAKPNVKLNTPTTLNTTTGNSFHKSNLPMTNTTNTTFLTSSSNAVPKTEYSTVMSNLASSVLQTVAERVREAPKIVRVDFAKEPKQKQSQDKSTEPTTTATNSENDEDLSIRIESVFSLISPESGEETDSSEETKHAVKDEPNSPELSKCVSKSYKRTRDKTKRECVKSPKDSLEKQNTSKCSKQSGNILDLMENVKLTKEALLDPLLNRATYVVLEKITYLDYNKQKLVKPCSRQCRERFIRRQEKQRMKDLQYKIAALKTKIKVKKWKNVSNQIKNKSSKNSSEHFEPNSDMEMPQLEPALASDPILASGIDIDMPDILNSPPSGSDKPHNSLNNTESHNECNKSRSGIKDSSQIHRDSTTKSQSIIPSVPSIDQTHVKIPYKLVEAQPSGNMKGGLSKTPSNLSVSLAGSLKTVNNTNSPQASKQATTKAPSLSLNIPSTLSPSNITVPTGTGANTKFYLIKVDDKSILIPAVNTGEQPRAYILDPKAENGAKLVTGHQGQNKSLNASTHGNSDNPRFVVPPGTTANTKLAKTWSNPPSVDPIKTSLVSAMSKGKSSAIPNLVANVNTSTNANTFGNVRVKQEPVTNGYGDEIIVPTIKKEKYRGYSDETPPENFMSSSPSKTIRESGGKRLNETNTTSNEIREHTDQKIPKIEDKNEDENAKAALKEERIKNLKDMLKRQEQALEELRRKRFSDTPPTLDLS